MINHRPPTKPNPFLSNSFSTSNSSQSSHLLNSLDSTAPLFYNEYDDKPTSSKSFITYVYTNVIKQFKRLFTSSKPPQPNKQNRIDPASLLCCTPQTHPSHHYEYLLLPPSTTSYSWSCTLGTSPKNGIWLNTTDSTGMFMAALVWFLIIYNMFTVSVICNNGGLKVSYAFFFDLLSILVLGCHVKTTTTDPGCSPVMGVPPPSDLNRDQQSQVLHCSRCNSFKPKNSHHCRICNRCVSGMDHHCPWFNNCIGVGNFKFFILFIVYTWIIQTWSLLIIMSNYFLCSYPECEYSTLMLVNTKFTIVLNITFLLFTSSMLMNISYGLITGVGTIDRLKLKSQNSMHLCEEESVEMKDVFGVGSWVGWGLPVDVVFEENWRVFGFDYAEE